MPRDSNPSLKQHPTALKKHPTAAKSAYNSSRYTTPAPSTPVQQNPLKARRSALAARHPPAHVSLAHKGIHLRANIAAQALKVLNMIKVYSKPIRVNKASQDKRTQDVGANLFIGNLDPEVDEKVRRSLNRVQGKLL